MVHTVVYSMFYMYNIHLMVVYTVTYWLWHVLIYITWIKQD
jgi:hypothetical protein